MKKTSIFYWWLFLILYLEIIYKIFIVETFFTINTFSVVLFSLIWVILLTLITSVFNEKINKILTNINTGIITIITLAQIVYFKFYHSIFSFFSLTTGTGQVMQFWQMIIEVILRIWYIFIIVLIPIILFYIYDKKIFKYKKMNYKELTKTLISLSLTLLIITFYIKIDNKKIYSLNNLIYKTHAPMLTINKTGLYTMQAIDFGRYIFGFKEELVIPYENRVTIDKAKQNVLSIDFDKLIKNSENETIKLIHKYFKNVTPTNKNEYTSLLKGKNIIFITAEAFDTISIDEKLTPTLYKMANNSLIFKNYYQPLFPVSTSDGEYMNLMSLVPKEGIWSFEKTSNLDMPFALGNTFKNLGYQTFAFHNYKYNFYNRQDSHKNIGFTYLGCGNGLEKYMDCSNWPNSDYELFKNTAKLYTENNKPFVSYYMTVSGHLNYTFSNNYISRKHKDKVEHLNTSKNIKGFYATQIDLDLAMQSLLEELEEKKLLDDTLILIAPDHYPYGLSEDQINEVSKINRKDKFELYHTSLIMYNPGIEKTIVDDIISGIDIIPTLYNLFGVEYDSRLFMGKDVFSNSDNIVIFSDRSWISKYGKYNSITKEFVPTTKEKIEKDYIEKINKEIANKFSISSLMLDTNYYGKLGL